MGSAMTRRHYACPLLGGDTDHTPGPLSVSITAFGAVPHGAMVRRATAKPGDSIVVTGTIGDAALGVMLRRDPALARALAAFARAVGGAHGPLSAAAAAQRARRRGAATTPRRRWMFPTACRRPRETVPSLRRRGGSRRCACAAFGGRAAAVAAQPALLETALTGGDDYEILLTLSPDKLPAFRAAAAATGVAVTEIGRVSAGQGARFIRDGKALTFARPSYSHF